MKKLFKNLILSAVLPLALIPTSKAFFLGSDAYTVEEYNEANIVWKHYMLFPDEYYFNEIRVTQKLAEHLVALYRGNFKKELQSGERDAYLYSLYIVVAQFTINTSKEVKKEVDFWKDRYHVLLAENIRLEGLLRRETTKINY